MEEMKDINRFELQAIRKYLFLDVSEAAECIGRVSNRAWQHWESGQRTIPEDVKIAMCKLLQERELLIEKLKAADDRECKWCRKFEEYLADNPDADKSDWRLYQSALAHLFVLDQIRIR